MCRSWNLYLQICIGLDKVIKVATAIVVPFLIFMRIYYPFFAFPASSFPLRHFHPEMKFVRFPIAVSTASFPPACSVPEIPCARRPLLGVTRSLLPPGTSCSNRRTLFWLATSQLLRETEHPWRPFLIQFCPDRSRNGAVLGIVQPLVVLSPNYFVCCVP